MFHVKHHLSLMHRMSDNLGGWHVSRETNIRQVLRLNVKAFYLK